MEICSKGKSTIYQYTTTDNISPPSSVEENPCDAVANVMDSDIAVSEFRLQSLY